MNKHGVIDKPLHRIFRRSKNSDDELAELNDRMDCVQRAIANLTRIIAEEREARRFSQQ